MAKGYYCLRTDKLSQPMYFCGLVPTNLGGAISISPSIFAAFEFESEVDAAQAIEDLSLSAEDWTTSYCEAGAPSIPRGKSRRC